MHLHFASSSLVHSWTPIIQSKFVCNISFCGSLDS
jgi:hypothetical protein